jgi:DNA-binding XRE family transcriptional regulator
MAPGLVTAVARFVSRFPEAAGPNGRIHFQHLTGPRLVAMRHFARWSQSELAKRAGVHPQTVKYWERQPGVIRGHTPSLFLQAFAAKRISVENVSRKEPGYVDPRQCRAKTRKGSPCKMFAVQAKTRCRLHGGLSTGP